MSACLQPNSSPCCECCDVCVAQQSTCLTARRVSPVAFPMVLSKRGRRSCKQVLGEGTGTAAIPRCCSSGTPQHRGRALLRSTPAGEKPSLSRREGAMVSQHLLFIRKLRFFLHPYPGPGGRRQAGPSARAGMRGWTRGAGTAPSSSDGSLFLITLEKHWCEFLVLFYQPGPKPHN